MSDPVDFIFWVGLEKEREREPGTVSTYGHGPPPFSNLPGGSYWRLWKPFASPRVSGVLNGSIVSSPIRSTQFQATLTSDLADSDLATSVGVGYSSRSKVQAITGTYADPPYVRDRRTYPSTGTLYFTSTAPTVSTVG